MKKLLCISMFAIALTACGGGGAIPLASSTNADTQSGSSLQPQSGGTQLAINPGTVTLSTGQSVSLTISGGVPPYTLLNACPPSATNNNAAFTESISGSTLTVSMQTKFNVVCSIGAEDSTGAKAWAWVQGQGTI